MPGSFTFPLSQPRKEIGTGFLLLVNIRSNSAVSFLRRHSLRILSRVAPERVNEEGA